MLSKNEIKYIQNLAQKKYRQQVNEFVVEGPKLTNELLVRKPDWLVKIYGTKNWWEKQPYTLQHDFSSFFVAIETFELEKISNLQTPQEVLAVVTMEGKMADGGWQMADDVQQTDDGQRLTGSGRRSKDDEQTSSSNHHPPSAFRHPNWLLALDGIQDPGNLGTIIRTAHWFGLKQIICSLDCADAFSPKVVQATMGSIFAVQIIYTDLEKFLSKQKLPVYGALLEGENIYEQTDRETGILLIGNEGKGISKTLLPLVSHPVTIPALGDAESLNAGVAAGILMGSLCQPLIS